MQLTYSTLALSFHCDAQTCHTAMISDPAEQVRHPLNPEIMQPSMKRKADEAGVNEFDGQLERSKNRSGYKVHMPTYH